MKTILVYPVDLKMLDEFINKDVSKYRYILVGINELDNYYIDSIKSKNIEYTTSLYDYSDCIDEVVLLDYKHLYVDISSDIEKIIKLFVKKNIKIYAGVEYKSANIDDNLKQKLIIYDKDIYKDYYIDNYSYNIRTPIVCLCSMDPYLDQFKIERNLYKVYKDFGLNVKVISSRTDAFLFDMIPFIDMNGKNDISDKIVEFNHFIKNIEIEFSPDIIILSIPSNILPIDRLIKSDYGIKAYIALSAVNVDYTILSLSRGFVDDIDYLIKHINYKYGIEIDSCVVSKETIDFSESRKADRIKYLDFGDSSIGYFSERSDIYSIDSDFYMDIVQKSLSRFYEYGEIKMI